MYSHCFFILHLASCMDIKISGEISFDLRISDFDRNRLRGFEKTKKERVDENGKGNQSVYMRVVTHTLRNVTVAPIVDCVYQYPEKEQINAILSNMMNQLTKVFVKVHSYVLDARRRPNTRFKVISQKNNTFFDHIYANMTQEYKKIYNYTADRVPRTDRDPCQNQEEIKKMWKTLLEASQKSLTTAALTSVKKYLESQGRTPQKTKRKIQQFLNDELKKIKASQLHVLCDSFQLCFNDLM